MNCNLLILFFCFLFNFSWGSDTIVSFHNSQIKLPTGFTEFSIEELTTFRSTIFDRQIMTVYEQMRQVDGLQRIIFYYDSLTGTKNLTFDKIIEIKLEVIKESGIVFSNVQINNKRYCAYGETIVLDDTSMFGFSVDGYGIMGIQFDNSNGINNSDKKKFSDLLKSIKHSSPYEYIPEKDPKVKKAKEEMENSGKLMTIALIAWLLIWMIRKYAMKKK